MQQCQHEEDSRFLRAEIHGGDETECVIINFHVSVDNAAPDTRGSDDDDPLLSGVPEIFAIL